MARQIVVTFGGAPTAFDFKKVDRAALYGRRRRVPLDPSGGPCTRAELTADGGYLLRPGMAGQGYVDGDGQWYVAKDLQPVDSQGRAAPVHDSTLGVEQALTPVGPEALLDARVQSVYALDAAEIDPALAAALAAGELFAFDFAYRGGGKLDRGILLSNDHGLWALITQPVSPEWCSLTSQVIEDWSAEVADDFDDDLDFEMF